MLFSIILMFLAFQTADWGNSLRSALWKDKEMKKFHLKNLQMMKSSNITNVFQYISWICQCQTDKSLRYGETPNVMFTWLADQNHPMVDNLVRLDNSENPMQFWIEEDILIFRETFWKTTWTLHWCPHYAALPPQMNDLCSCMSSVYHLLLRDHEALQFTGNVK